MVALIAYADHLRVESKAETLGLQLARAWVAQTESLRGLSKQGEAPFEWKSAIQLLRKRLDGNEQQIFYARLKPQEKSELERYEYGFFKGEFDYTKVLDPESGDAIRVVLQLPYEGLLGASNTAMNAVYLGALLLLFYTLFYLSTLKLVKYHAPDERFRSRLRSWMEGARTTFDEVELCVLDIMNQLEEYVTSRNDQQSQFQSRLNQVKPMVQQSLLAVTAMKNLAEGYLRLARQSQKMHQEALAFGEDGKVLAGTAEQACEEFVKLNQDMKTFQKTMFFFARELAEWAKLSRDFHHSDGDVQQSQAIQVKLEELSKTFDQHGTAFKKLTKTIERSA